MVWPSLKPRSSLGVESGACACLVNSSSCFTHLTWGRQICKNTIDGCDLNQLGVMIHCEVTAYLKWSWSATLKSKASPRSPNPIPMKALWPGREKRARRISWGFEWHAILFMSTFTKYSWDNNKQFSHPCHLGCAAQSNGLSHPLFPLRSQGTPLLGPVQTAPL